jgi:hypothetical protein
MTLDEYGGGLRDPERDVRACFLGRLGPTAAANGGLESVMALGAALTTSLFHPSKDATVSQKRGTHPPNPSRSSGRSHRSAHDSAPSVEGCR